MTLSRTNLLLPLLLAILALGLGAPAYADTSCLDTGCPGDEICKGSPPTCQANSATCNPACSGSTPICDSSSGTPTCISTQTYGDQSVPGIPSTGANTTGLLNTSPTNGITLLNPLGSGSSLPGLLSNILQFVVKIGSVIVILMLVYVGFLFVTARGEPGKISEARTALLWTIIGALVLLGAEAIAQGIQATVSALSTGG